jgi:hypothetical protein
MDTEFINEYIAKLTSTTHELLNKNIMLETRLAMAEKVSSNLREQLKSLMPDEGIKKK